MTYVEIAVSDGPGTLIGHKVEVIGPSNWRKIYLGKNVAITTLTESEYQDFIAMHGGPVAT